MAADAVARQFRHALEAVGGVIDADAAAGVVVIVFRGEQVAARGLEYRMTLEVPPGGGVEHLGRPVAVDGEGGGEGAGPPGQGDGGLAVGAEGEAMAARGQVDLAQDAAMSVGDAGHEAEGFAPPVAQPPHAQIARAAWGGPDVGRHEKDQATGTKAEQGSPSHIHDQSPSRELKPRTRSSPSDTLMTTSSCRFWISLFRTLIRSGPFSVLSTVVMDGPRSPVVLIR